MRRRARRRRWPPPRRLRWRGVGERTRASRRRGWRWRGALPAGRARGRPQSPARCWPRSPGRRGRRDRSPDAGPLLVVGVDAAADLAAETAGADVLDEDLVGPVGLAERAVE